MRAKADKPAKRIKAAALPAAMLLALLPAFMPAPIGFGAAQAQFWQRSEPSGKAKPAPMPRSRADAPLRQKEQAEAAAPRRSFWDRLFGRNKPREGAERRESAPPPRRPPPAKPAALPKNADARRVLVLGDFTAAALSDALARLYNDNPNILIRSKTENNSGLLRAAFYDWPAAIKNLSAREKPNLIILMLGANDRLPRQQEGAAETAADTAAAAACQARAESMARNLQKSGAAWIWIGLPPFKDDGLNSNAAALNRIYRSAAERGGGHFVDIWGGFVDDKGNFAFSGYDVDGKTVRLRASDGINFTPAGRRKLAFYAGQAIDLLWGDAASGQPLFDSANGGKISNARLAPINPLDIGAAGKPVLAGGGAFSPNPQALAAAVKEETATGASGKQAAQAEQNSGRADDFRLKPPAQKPAPK